MLLLWRHELRPPSQSPLVLTARYRSFASPLPLFRPLCAHLGRGGQCGGKFRVTAGLPTGAIINCADNTGAKSLGLFAVKGLSGVQNRLPSASVGDYVMASVKQGVAELRKKGMSTLSPHSCSAPVPDSLPRYPLFFLARLRSQLALLSRLALCAGPFRPDRPLTRCSSSLFALVSALRTTVTPAIVIRQRKAWRRPDGYFIMFEGTSTAQFRTRARAAKRSPGFSPARTAHPSRRIWPYRICLRPPHMLCYRQTPL